MCSNICDATTPGADTEAASGDDPRRASAWEEYISLCNDAINDEQNYFLSDEGACVERMLDEIDGRRDKSFYVMRTIAARNFVRRNAPRLLPVLNLILKNGKNRKESIWQMLKIPRNGNKLRLPISKRSKRFCGSSDAPKQIGKVKIN